jgi:hypothetical protein
MTVVSQMNNKSISQDIEFISSLGKVVQQGHKWDKKVTLFNSSQWETLSIQHPSNLSSNLNNQTSAAVRKNRIVFVRTEGKFCMLCSKVPIHTNVERYNIYQYWLRTNVHNLCSCGNYKNSLLENIETIKETCND